jgi:tetratricopeptide (TPR) repeat protein
MAHLNRCHCAGFNIANLVAAAALVVLTLSLIITQHPVFGAEEDSETPPLQQTASATSLDDRIQQLIEQLGSEQYATRERAQSELKRLGLTAFDALYEAQNHEDIEISLRAQYLVRSLTVDWANEDDPNEVKRILRGYSDKKEKDRKTRMDQLGKLPEWMGTEALARLARFERSPVLSKQAALLVMSQTPPDDSPRRERLASRIEGTMELSKRPAAQWLRTHAQTLRDPESTLDAWKGIITDEQRTLEEYPGKTSRDLVLSLLRWQAEFLIQLDREDEAQGVMRQAVTLLQGSREQIIETIDWLMAHEAWTLVDEIATRYSDLFAKDSLLLYRLAESQLKQQKTKEAEAAALKAFEVPNENTLERLEWAYRLHQSRGLVDWAEREYRFVIEKEPLVSAAGLRARQRLAEMLHDHERNQAAAEVYQPVAQAIERDPNVERGVMQAQYDPAGIQSRFHYFLAEHARQQKDYETQRAELGKAVQYDPTEADALIAMHHSPDADSDFRDKARRLIESASSSFREQIAQQRLQSERLANNDVMRERADYYLAMFNNQFAWLVSNTFGDFKEALRLSHESLTLRPNTGAYLDTLAHCYHAVGDLENAVKYQSLAAEQEPHADQIGRKLAFFKKELERSKKKPSK